MPHIRHSDNSRVRLVLFLLSFFFFSSRRRHTRCSRDWSSDVCSSDLSRTDSTRTDSAKVADTTARTAAPVGVPFPVGERLVYGARYGPFSVGTATMQVAGIDTVRGGEAVHFVFLIDGGPPWYHIHPNLQSLVGRHDFRSRRFLNQTEE